MRALAVIGVGVVGSHMVADIERAGHACVKHDPARGWDDREAVNRCEAAFICVGTPQAADGHADLSALHEVFTWLRVPVAIVRSTIPPGTPLPDWAAFSLELIGEGVNAPYNAMRQPPFVVIGADRPETRAAAAVAFATIYNAECEFVFLDLISAQLAKYAENYHFALRVSWANELYNISQVLGANYHEMMATVTHDYRIGRSHTHVYPDRRGWGGRCLPKDTAALLALVGEETAPLLAAVRRVNDRHTGAAAELQLADIVGAE